MFRSAPSLRWSVPTAGFCWLDGEWVLKGGRATSRSLLVETNRQGGGRKVYSPFQETGLCRRFAELTTNKESILTFANTFGSLGLAESYQASSALGGRTAGPVGEAFERWCSEIFRMREAVRLLDLVKSRDQAGLSRLLSWRPGGKDRADCWLYRPSGGSLVAVECKAACTPLDIYTPALGQAMAYANESLRGGVSLALTPDDLTGKPAFELRVGTLLEALWLQLAQAMVEGTDYRRCRTCGTWFAVVNDGRKADQVFCRDACKSRDFRHRRARAQELAAAGKRPKEIAEALGSDVATVKRWVRAGRK